MSWVAASGWDTNETCEAGISTIVALARSAMNTARDDVRKVVERRPQSFECRMPDVR